MLRVMKTVFLALAVVEGLSLENDSQGSLPEDWGNSEESLATHSKISAPAFEIFMHLPPEFEHTRNLLSFMQRMGFSDVVDNTEPTLRRKRESNVNDKGFSSEEPDMQKKTAEEGEESQPAQDSSQPHAEKLEVPPDSLSIPLLGIPEGIKRTLYDPFESGMNDSPDVRPVNDNEDRVLRDKRTFMDGTETDRETTTPLPYWKRKKENPQFVTGRDGNNQKVSGYQPAQHRSVDSARESHSLKDLDKSVQSNEIAKSNSDSYYSSTNRRTYNSRQAESFTPRTPKSVYDTIDYSNRRRNQDGRNGFGRNYDGKRQTSDNGQPQQFARQYASYPRPYDRPYYPFNGDIIGRGVEYYHRTFDPVTGRIIYYANMPEPSRQYEPNFAYSEPIGRSVYVNGRTYLYDPYGRNLMYPNDYRFMNGYGRNIDYMRNGRSNPDNYYYHHQGGEKWPRNARYNTGYDKGDPSKDDFRNRTYIIFDAEENGWQDRRGPLFTQPDMNRFGYPIPPYGLPFGPITNPQSGYPNYSYRGQYYPAVQTPAPWPVSQKPFLQSSPSNYATRAFNGPEVQLPLTTRNRSLQPSPEFSRVNKT